MDYIDDDDMQNLLGLKLGIEKPIGNNLISGFTFSQRGYKVEYGLSDQEMNVNYISGYLLKPKRLSSNFDLLVGLELGFLWGGKTKLKVCVEDECESDSESFDLEDWSEDMNGDMIDYGFVIGGRIPFSENISINSTYYYGLAHVFDNTDIKNRSFQIYLSYGI